MLISIMVPLTGGGGCSDIGAVLLDSGTSNTTFWVRNMGGDPPYGKDPGGFPPPCGDTDNEENPTATIQQKLELRNEEARSRGTGYLHLQTSENGGPVHCD